MGGQIVVPTPGNILQGPIFSDFEPQRALIQSVTNATQALVTTTTNHGYSNGIYVRIDIPIAYGMNMFQETIIVVTSPSQFLTQIDTTTMDPFVAPSLYPPVAFTPAQCIPMGGVTDNIA